MREDPCTCRLIRASAECSQLANVCSQPLRRQVGGRVQLRCYAARDLRPGLSGRQPRDRPTRWLLCEEAIPLGHLNRECQRVAVAHAVHPAAHLLIGQVNGWRPGPTESFTAQSPELWALVQRCWSNDAEARPDFTEVCVIVEPIVKKVLLTESVTGVCQPPAAAGAGEQ